MKTKEELLTRASCITARVEAICREFSVPVLGEYGHAAANPRQITCSLSREAIDEINGNIKAAVEKFIGTLEADIIALGVTRDQVSRYREIKQKLILAKAYEENLAWRTRKLEREKEDLAYAAKCAAEADALQKEIDEL